MRTLFVALLALALGVAITLNWRKPSQAADPLQVITTQIRTHAIIEHERQIAIWYRSCPEVTGVDPEIFVAWPGKLSYELDLANVEITRTGTAIKVRTAAIRADEPAVPTDFMDYLTTSPWLNFSNEQELVNREIAKASPIARYLSVYFQRRDPSLVEQFRDELHELVERLAGALGVEVTSIEVEIPQTDVKPLKLPPLTLCANSFAAVNGVSFANVDDGYTIPIGFDAPLAAGRSQRSQASAPTGQVRGVVAGLATGKP